MLNGYAVATAFPGALAALGVALQAAAPDAADQSLLDKGVLGAVAVSAVGGLVYVTRRFVTHLESNGRAQTEAIVATGNQLQAMRKEMDDEREARRRELREVLDALTRDRQ